MKGIAFAFLLTLALNGGELEVERVFGPEVPTGAYKHPASIMEFQNGDLYIVYYGGTAEYAIDTGVFGSRRKKGESRWSPPRLLAKDPFRSVGNGVIWQAPDRTVWLFYVVRWGDTWSTSRIQAKISKDHGDTWSDSFVIAQEEGMMVRNKPILLDTGEYLLPIYHETGEDTGSVGADSTSRFLRFDPATKKWRSSGIIRSKKGNIQPGVVQIDSQRLIAYCRRGGGYGRVTDGYAVRSESNDGGWTWSAGENSRFPNPNSALELLKLKSGNLLMIYNNSMHQRTPLTAALSTDNDKSWPYRRNIGELKNESYAYPAAVQSADGKIHVVYTSQRRTVINHAVFEEKWIQQEDAQVRARQ